MSEYFQNKIHPRDTHCPAQLTVLVSKLKKFKENEALSSKVVDRTLGKMQHKKGCFYDQLRKEVSSQTI